MHRSYTDQASAYSLGCKPYAYAGSQQDPLPVQRFSSSEVQSSVGHPTYLPFERQSCASQHPCASRLRPKPDARANQTLPAHKDSSRLGSAAQEFTAATAEPLNYTSRYASSCQTSQGTYCPCNSCCLPQVDSSTSPFINLQCTGVLCSHPCFLLLQHYTSM